MRFNRPGNRLAYLCSTLCVLAACGDDGGSTGDDDGGADIDAAGGGIDAEPMPDGPPGAYSCIGDPHPTTAPATINVTGVSEEIDQNGTTPLEGVLVTARDTSDTMLDSDTSAATTGAYALQLTTGGTPVNGYLEGAISGYQTTYIYPPAGISGDFANIPVLMVADLTWSFLPVLAQAPEDGNQDQGFVGILVVDCTGTPVGGATVTVAGADPANVRYPQDGSVPTDSSGATDATGIALIFDVPPGASVMVDASTPDHEFEAHAIAVRLDSVTTTVVAPGPITSLAP